MEAENWKKVVDRYYTPEEQAHWAERAEALPGDFDPQAYAAAWSELGAKIEAALPLDPSSSEAQAFLEQWQALLKPFTDLATPQMTAGAANLYNRMDEWQGDRRPPFSQQVWAFIQAAGKAKAEG